MAQKFYIAFSIAGTRKFTVATFISRKRHNWKKEDIPQYIRRVLGEDFTMVSSRRPGYNSLTDGIKVHWKGLLTQEGAPMKSKSWITRRFTELKALGWVIVHRD